jgi:hypothetical protein
MSVALDRSATRVSLTLLTLIEIGCSPASKLDLEVADAGQLTLDAGDPWFEETQLGDAGPSTTELTVVVTGLRGAGLTLSLAGQPLSVARNGSYLEAISLSRTPASVLVTQQPSAPTQRCTVSQVAAREFTVRCEDTRSTLSGSVRGLVGSGLVLTSGTDELAIDEDGAFTFPTPVEGGTAYSVVVAQQPRAPLQSCVVQRGAGIASSGDVSDLEVVCTVTAYSLTARVSGLVGKGLELTAQAGEAFLVPAGDAPFGFALPDGFAYAVDVARQPSEPDQRCYVVSGTGVLHGDATFEVRCDALGGLRITEVGSCPYANSACWFELVNVSDAPEQLAQYRVRTSALSASAYASARIFDLPSVVLPPGATLVLQARSSPGQPDGGNVYHLADGDALPWWTSHGFVELLNAHGATQDFVRFGESDIAPTTGGTWAGGVVPALPIGQGGYGYSVAHARQARAVSSAADWRLTAFSTYAGSNDVTSDADADQDGIPDQAEVPGGGYAGLDLYAMGARTNQRDLFVELERMDSSDPAVVPRRAALDKVVAAFAKRGIAVHFDAGNLFAASFDPQNHNLGGGGPVPFSKAVGFSRSDEAIPSLYDIKSVHMAGARRALFYYMLFGWSQNADGSGGPSGLGEVSGNDSMITLGGFNLGVNNSLQRNLLTNYQAATMMHELGHNLGLRHGGGDSRNLKPNYLSVMNYLYSPVGLPTLGASEGDRYDLYHDCSLYSVLQLQRPPTGDVDAFVLDYSDGTSADLDERSVSESDGLGRPKSGAVDFNCNMKIDGSNYSQDLNADKSLEVLTDHDDWSSLSFVFRRTVAGAENGRALRWSVAHTQSDTLTADEQHDLDPPCPEPRLR